MVSLASGANISSVTSIVVNAGGSISLGGVLNAPLILVNNGGGTVTVLDGTQIVTTGTIRPTGALTMDQLPSSTTSTSGFYLTTGLYQQNGALTVSGATSTARIDASSAVQFGNSGGIVDTTGWVILSLTSGASATGAVDVNNLDAVFAGSTAGTALTGSVHGLSGNAAAGAANISPGTNSTFQINGCPISSVNCVLITTQGIPAASPLRDFTIGSVFNPTDEDDLLLPLVSDEVY
jgi:hypothetical protein